MTEIMDKQMFEEEWERLAHQLRSQMGARPMPAPGGLDPIYRGAYQALQVEDYVQAENLFILLTSLDRVQGHFWGGLAAALEGQEAYEGALLYYCVALALEGKKAPLLFKAGQCLLALERREEAIILFEMASEAGNAGKKLADITAGERAKNMIRILAA